jgi:hypothetical protein
MTRAFQLCGLYPFSHPHCQNDRIEALYHLSHRWSCSSPALETRPSLDCFLRVAAFASSGDVDPPTPKSARKPKKSKRVKEWGLVNDTATLPLQYAAADAARPAAARAPANKALIDLASLPPLPPPPVLPPLSDILNVCQ